jgi:uncharacterized membrane protein YgcG
MFRVWCRKLLRPTPPAPVRRTGGTTRLRLGVEALEAREVPAFLTPTTYAAGANPGGIAVGDFNGDGRDDMAVVSQGFAGSVGVFLSNADGSFGARADYSAGANPVDAAAGDLNGDGKADLVVVGSGVSVLLGNGDGTFAAPVAYAAGWAATSIKIGDFNGDGRADVGTMAPNTAGVLLGNGDGTLRAPLATPVAGNNINLVVGDFDRDGRLDMATSNTTSVGTVSVLRGRGDGSFGPAASYYAFSAPVYLAAGDFNNDGYTDFACPNSYAATSMSVLLNNGDGTYAPPHTYGIAQTGYEIEVADFNGDGNDDYAVRGASLYMVHVGKGDGTFYAEQTFPTPAGRFEAGTHGDFNGDGAVDFAYPGGGGVTVVTNDHADAANLAGAVTFRVAAPATTTSGSVLPMTVTAVDAAGQVVPAFRGTVYISSSDPAASTASGYAFNPLDAGIPYVFTAADQGSHAFAGAIRLVTGGDQTVTVSAPNMTPAAAGVTVTGQVARLVFSAPTAANAGDTVSVTVTAADAQGTAAAGYSSTVHFTSSDPQAGLPADYTFTDADAGVHTFAVTLKSSGPRYVGATEVGGTVGGGATVAVTPGAAVSLALAGGGGAVGVARPVTVVARDVYGNTATGYSGTVHFTSSDAAAVLPADAALANGVATANVTLLTVGTQTVTATDAAAPALTGTLFSDATPPIPALFSVAGFPATVAGVSNGFTVTVRDTIGQVATGYTGTVFFSSSDVQAGLPASYTFTPADAGVHTFTATFKTAGTQSITVRDSTGILTGSQAGVAVSPAAFAGFRLSVPNGSDSKGHILVTAGEAVALTVRAVDAFGNTLVGYRGKVKVTSTDALAALPADYSFAAADAGVHTFTVVLKTATPNGVVWSFGVADAANTATLATLTNFEVTNAPAARFVLNLPSNITAGSPFAMKVTVLDAYGNMVKNYFGTLHFGNTAGVAGLPADYAFTGTDAGVHLFTLTLGTTGTQTISATDLAIPSLTATVLATANAPGGGGGGGGGGGSGGGGSGGGSGGGGKKT